MNNLQKMGGIAALYEGAAYLVGIVFFLFVVDYTSVTDPVGKLNLLLENQTILYFMNLIIYVIFGIFLVILSLALYERLKAGARGMMQVATAFGLIWAVLVIASGMVANIGSGVVVDLYNSEPAQAATVWLAIDTMVDGIGGGNEIVGGLWLLLVSWAALRVGEFPKALNYLGVVVGAAGIISAVPALGEIGGMIFGFGQLVWFFWLGIVMLRSSKSVATEEADAYVPQPGATS